MDNSVIYIFGHKHPDSDSVCSAIAYADLKRKQGYNAEARVLDEINKETEFILDYFGVPVPPVLKNVNTQVCDLNIDLPEKISPETSMKKAWSLMEESSYKTLPVVDCDDRLLGIVSLSNITEKYMDVYDYNAIGTSGTTIDNICETLNAGIEVGSDFEFNTTGKVHICMEHPNMLSSFVEKGDIAILNDNEERQTEAIRLGAVCLVLTNGHKVSEKIKKLAEEAKCIVISTGLDTYTTARLISQSVPISSIMHKNDSRNPIVKFRNKDFIDNIKDAMLKNRYRSYPVVDENEKICGFVSRYHLLSQRKKRVILVDHNEKAQTCLGIDEAEVLEIIDHHKVGDMTTSSPILFKNEPVGSTATIIANMYQEQGRSPSVQIAGILCSAIISDTLKFQSPTCTDYDKKTAEKLAKISGINLDEFAGKMFTAGSELKGRSPKEIYAQDFKRFSFNDYACGVSQITILNKDYISNERPQIIEYMKNFAKTEKFNLLALMITELSTRTTELWLTGDIKNAVMKEFKPDAAENCENVVFDRLMSRKKDIIPVIDSAIEKINL